MLSQRRFPDPPSNQTPYVPFCRDVRDFVTQSFNIHTHCANLEGARTRRRLKLVETEKKVDYLKQFIECTLYPDESFHLNLDAEKNAHVEKLTSKVVSIGLEYFTDEIHFSSVWMCFFNYAENKLNNIPFIKVFKFRNLSNDDAVYIDVNGNCFKTWEEVIELAEIPSSFICIPRHGKYNKINGKLDLEYVSKFRANNRHSIAKRAPFSVTVIVPSLEIVQNFCSSILKVEMDSSSFILATIMGYFEKVFSKSNLVEAGNQLKKILIMLYDKHLNIDFKGLFKGIYLPNNLEETYNVLLSVIELITLLLPPAISAVNILVALYLRGDSVNFVNNLRMFLWNLSDIYQKSRDYFDKKGKQPDFSNFRSLDVDFDKKSNIFSSLEKIEKPSKNKLSIIDINSEELTTLIGPESGFDPVFRFKNTSFCGVVKTVRNIVKANFSLTVKNDNDGNRKWEITQGHEVVGYLIAVEDSVICCFSKNLFGQT